MNIRKIMSVLLVWVLVLALLPQEALARQSERYWFQSEPVERHMSRTGSMGPALSEGNHQHYQDRLKDLPDYAMEFYRWLEQNATAAGVLADPTLGTAYGSDYYYSVTRISGSETFTFQTNEQKDAIAADIAKEALYRELETFSAYASAMYSVFDREHPEVFWLNSRSKYGAQCEYSYSSRGKTCTVYYDLDMIFWLKAGSFDIRNGNYPTKEAVTEGIALRDAAVQEILDGCTATRPYEQICYLNRALTQRNAYNRAVAEGRSTDADSEAWECISALTGRAGDRGPVCEGYSRAFMVLCQRLGIPCVLADGMARSRVNETPGEHMWNYVLLEGDWYAVDVSWNDSYVPQMPEVTCSGRETEDWLLLGLESPVDRDLRFGQSHIETNDIGGNGLCYTNGPKVSRSAYVPKATYSLDGTVTSYGDKTAPVTLKLQAEDTVQTLSITGNRGEYCFEQVLPGSYTLTVSKEGHVAREYAITVEAGTEQDVKIHLIGDVTGDGRVNVADTSKVYSHVKGTALLTDYAFACADVDGNGKINVADTSKVYSHAKGTKPLW